MTTDIFANAQQVPTEIEQRGCVQATSLIKDRLNLAKSLG
jgi:hypothetical protein